MKMGNTVPKVGLELTSLAFQASVMSPLYLCLPVYVAPCLRGQCRLLHMT